MGGKLKKIYDDHLLGKHQTERTSAPFAHFRLHIYPTHLERTSGDVEVVPLDEKQRRSGLVFRVELHQIRPISHVL